MAARDVVNWDWIPFDDLPINSPYDEENGIDPATVDPRAPLPEIVDIDASISAMEEELTKLKLRRLHVLGEHALVNQIPHELLSRIFELGTHENQHLLPIVSLVSRQWRQITLATPTLWSYIKLDHDWNYGRSAEFLRKVKIYMERSQDAKILVDLDFRYSESHTDARLFMAALQTHLSRCFSFRISVPDWDWMSIVKEYSQDLGANLEEVALRIDPGDADDAVPIAILQRPLPKLRTLILEQAPLTCVRAVMPGLRRFHVARDPRYHTNQRIRIALRDLLSMLTSTNTIEDVRLQTVVFCLDGSEAVFNGVHEPIVVPHLTDLSISYLDATNVGVFLDSVSLPSLHRLAVQMDAGPEGDNLGWLMRLSLHAHVTMPSLRHLELRACNVDGPALLPFVRALHKMPQLTVLGLSAPPSGNIGANFFKRLETPPETPLQSWLLPNLEVLSLSGCRDVSGHELLRVIRARRSAPSKDVKGIKLLRLAPCYPLDADIFESLKQSVDVLKIICS